MHGWNTFHFWHSRHVTIVWMELNAFHYFKCPQVRHSIRRLIQTITYFLYTLRSFHVYSCSTRHWIFAHVLSFVGPPSRQLERSSDLCVNDPWLDIMSGSYFWKEMAKVKKAFLKKKITKTDERKRLSAKNPKQKLDLREKPAWRTCFKLN